MYRHSGVGIKSVKKLFSGLTNRQASHLLHSLAGEIYSSYGLKITKRSKRIGEVEVSDTPLIHHLDPRREDYMIEGVIGGEVEGVVKVYFDVIEEDLGFPIVYNRDMSAEKSLLKSLTLNIEHNILKAQPRSILEDVFEPVSELIYVDKSYEIKEQEIDEESMAFRVESIDRKEDHFRFKIVLEAEFFIYAEKSGSRMRYLENI